MSATMQEFQQLGRRVKQLDAQLAFLYKQLGVTYVAETAADDPRIIDLIQKGKMFDAIGLYRELNSVSMTDAKQVVEDLQHKLGLK
jgi:hypothetical protein